MRSERFIEVQATRETGCACDIFDASPRDDIPAVP